MSLLKWFAVSWLAVAVLVGCSTGNDSAPASVDVDTTVDVDTAAVVSVAPVVGVGGEADYMARRIEEKTLLESKKKALVAKFLQYGDEARERANWVEAQRNYVRVLEIDPGNELAKRRLDEASAVLGAAPAALRDAMDSAVEIRQVRRQQAQMEISDLVAVARRLQDEGNFDGAIRKIEKAQLIAGLFPYFGDFSPNESQLKQMIAGTRAAKVQAEKRRREAEIKEAQEMSEMDDRRMRQARVARINALFQQANLAMERHMYDSAREYFDRILRMDATNEAAARLSDLARKAKLSTEGDTTRRNLREQWRLAFQEIDAATMPQSPAVLFPKDWLSVQGQRQPYGFGRDAASGRGDPRAREIEGVLATTMVHINFEDTRLIDAVKFLAEYANVNIIVLPSVFEDQTEDELLIDLKADNISVANALELITMMKHLSYRIDMGVVQIGTSAEGMGEMLLDLYDVKDLTVPIVNFPGEDINLIPSGGFGFGFFEDEEIEPRQAFEGDALADLIREAIDIEVWDEGGDVQFREGGILIISAPSETHAKIRDLLDGLRATGGLTVQIETRFVTVEDNFLQEIGVDVRGLGDNSGGLGVRGRGRLETFDDILAGAPGTPIGLGTGNQAGVFYNLHSDGDIRGRVENLLDVALGRSGLLTGSGGMAIQATYLDDTQVELILRAVEKSSRSTLVVAPKLTVYNHERANITILNQVSYIQDFDVEIAQAAQIGDPIVQTLRDGVILDVTPIVSADRKYITLELRPTVALLKRPIATFTTTLANGPPVTIQLPEINVQRVRTTVTMPDGGILLLGGLKFFQEQRIESTVPWLDKIPLLNFFWSRKGTYLAKSNLIVLIKAKILVMEEIEPRLGAR